MTLALTSQLHRAETFLNEFFASLASPITASIQGTDAVIVKLRTDKNTIADLRTTRLSDGTIKIDTIRILTDEDEGKNMVKPSR